MDDGRGSPREDPRVTRSKAAVIATTLEVVAERGITGTSVDEISQRSGVAKTTIYRHWDAKADIVVAALSSVLGPPPQADTGELRKDLYELVEGFAWLVTESPLAGLMPALMSVAERDGDFAALHELHARQRHAVVGAAVERGIARGELPVDTDVDAALDLLAGPVLYRRMMRHGRVDRDFNRRVVDVVLAGLTAGKSCGYRPGAA